jgi:hypothetical protein
LVLFVSVWVVLFNYKFKFGVLKVLFVLGFVVCFIFVWSLVVLGLFLLLEFSLGYLLVLYLPSFVGFNGLVFILFSGL